MTEKYYTPSLGDEVLDLTDCDPYNMGDGAGVELHQVLPSKPTANSNELHSQPQITLASRKQQQLPKTSYTSFFREKACVIKMEKPELNYNELSQIIKPLWQALSTEEKARYNDAQGATTRTGQQNESTVTLSSSEEDNSPNGNAESAVAQEIFGVPDNKRQAAQLSNKTASAIESTKSVDETAEQMLNEASGARKCTRENCNKRAIINPDWEDEYCSNECVILHCRGVFSNWVDNNKEQKKN